MPPVLIDSSIWIDHVNKGHEQVALLLRRRRVVMHPMVLGEIALGSISRRASILTELAILPRAPAVTNADMLAIIEGLELFNAGIGLVDAHLIASIRLVPGGLLFTRDKRLLAQAERFDAAYTPE